ncbi:MAG: hypothetical protein ACJ79L_13070, partial [Anaeromyxobacteraceae bacterium]
INSPGLCLNGACTRGCPSGLDQDCPSGFQCSSAVCVPLQDCSTVLNVFGLQCADDNALDCPALADAKCFGLVKHNDQVSQLGYCTSRCLTNADCPTTRGFSCNGGFCTR